MSSNSDDFKYVIQDINSLYFGRELKYSEMLDSEDIPFKFKAVIHEYVQKDTDVEKSMAGHLLEIARTEFTFKVFEQLKMSVRICYKVEKKSFTGKIKEKWEHKVCSLKQFCDVYREDVKSGNVQIEDISISKLALMAFGI